MQGNTMGSGLILGAEYEIAIAEPPPDAWPLIVVGLVVAAVAAAAGAVLAVRGRRTS